MGNDEYLLRLIAAGERAQARDYAAWLLGAAGGYAIKIVNPGGVELWKRGRRDRIGLDTPVGSDRVTPRAILETLVDAANGAAPAARGAHPLQQPRRGRQRRHDARQHARASTAAARTSRTCSSTATARRRTAAGAPARAS